jgi:hypothetical protein
VTQYPSARPPDVKHFTFSGRVWDYCNGTQAALQEKYYEGPTIGILVVQVRRIRAIPGDVFQSAADATFVTRPLISVAAANGGGLDSIRRC